MKELALTIEGHGTIQAPVGIPQGVSLKTLVQAGLAVFTTVGILIALIMLAYGGFMWITSGGDKQKVDKARKTIVYSAIGIIVMALGFIVVNVITSALGVNGLIAK